MQSSHLAIIVGGALMNTNGLILLQPANNSIFAGGAQHSGPNERKGWLCGALAILAAE
jgi:hypothetical protein